MQDLRRMTDDLGRLIDQIRTLRHNIYCQPEQRYRGCRSGRLENLRAAGKIAQALASALDTACERHPQHQALLCLDPDLEGPPSLVRFRLQYHTNHLIGNADSDKHPWIDVEFSLLDGPIESRPHRWNEKAPLRLSTTNAQTRETPVLVSSNVAPGAAPVTRRRLKKQPEHTKHSLGNIFRKILVVQSANGSSSSRHPKDLGRLSHVSERSHQIRQGPSRQADEPSDNNKNNKNDRKRLSDSTQAATSYLSPTESPPESVNVIGKDFCARVQSFRSSTDRQNPSIHIGNLRALDTVLAASISHASSLQALSKPASTLTNILNNIRHQQGSDTEPSPAPYHKRLLWAKQLSRSVLLFHNSPWLPRSFSSKSIYLRETPGERHITSDGMYVEKSFGDTDGRNAHPPSARQFVSNPYLFGLGVLLLELGFEASCELLSTPEDEAQANGTLGNLEFFTATRLTAIASQTLGMKYASIAKKCLQCDFGCGNDLKDPVLQEAVYRQVYCQLEEMEQGLREILGMVETPAP
ncbi:hypothetical protein GJ744_006328 [Endocarpon pusillum]|uniref:DUF7580 domain-containing protein n=1 Tax=Endocarpon pusillum TaxID=364733 RepID=A0A8H7ALY6_9EURO|nr:hypothetical protein GJ744_006328 [Endocarpon pusillum]